MTKNLKRLQSLLFLSIGIALSAYALIAIGDLMASARAVLMLGSRYQPGSIVPDRIIATMFLLFLITVGAGLIVTSIRGIIGSYKK